MPVKTEYLSMAQAARASGGKIYVQVAEVINDILLNKILFQSI